MIVDFRAGRCDLFRVDVGETGEEPAPKEQPPRKLSGKRTTRPGLLERGARAASADGITISGKQTEGALWAGTGRGGRRAWIEHQSGRPDPSAGRASRIRPCDRHRRPPRRRYRILHRAPRRRRGRSDRCPSCPAPGRTAHRVPGRGDRDHAPHSPARTGHAVPLPGNRSGRPAGRLRRTLRGDHRCRTSSPAPSRMTR